MENIKDDFEFIRRKIIHIKSRPTFKNISSIYSLLDKYGYKKDIKILGYNKYDHNNILELCKKIEETISKNSNPSEVKTNNHFVSIKFEESLLLPEHIYRSVKDVNDIEDIDDIESLVNSVDSEIEDIDEEYYDSGNDEFSE